MPRIFTFAVLALLLTAPLMAQNFKTYTTAQAHSHNDYTRARPFFDAYDQQFGSIEADLHLVNDVLYVAHDTKDIRPNRTLSELYIKPLMAQIEKNQGHVYPQENAPLQLLIDLKTAGEPTLAALVKELEAYKDHLAPIGQVMVVVSGNVPDPSLFAQYPPFIYFDGRPENTYSPEQLRRIGLISQAFQKYSRWNGEGPIPEKDKKAVAKMIGQVHDLGKKVRLWATPDNINSWKTMMALRVDYLNTDKVREMGDYLRNAPR